MDIVEKAAYLRGLCDGLDIDTDTKEGKLLVAIVDVIDELAASVSDLEAVADEMSDELDEVAEELLELEGAFDDDCDCDECGDDCECDDFHYEVVCPTCGDSIMVDEDILALGTIQCPGCGEDLEFDMDECCCGDDCDCGDDCHCEE